MVVTGIVLVFEDKTHITLVDNLEYVAYSLPAL